LSYSRGVIAGIFANLPKAGRRAAFVPMDRKFDGEPGGHFNQA